MKMELLDQVPPGAYPPREAAYGVKENIMAKICPDCGDEINVVEVYCRGREQRGEPMRKVENCRCLHPGDLMCDCGNPCSSFF